MLLFEVGPVVGLLLLALWVYCIFDVISTEAMLVRNLPKGAWLFLVIILPDVGAIAWLLMGRPVNAGWRPGDTSIRPVRRVRGPDDDPDFLPPRTQPSMPMSDEERLRRWEADLQRREQSLKGEPGDAGDAAPEDPDPDKPFPFTW